jgi:hypothetical protein
MGEAVVGEIKTTKNDAQPLRVISCVCVSNDVFFPVPSRGTLYRLMTCSTTVS